ncbi:MAG TPA: DUF58 domain-containing protein [Flavilitoribacter sp.]|nr:DUF58 domain-containing protein [Flavilitoribacter sp.]HMQ86007.1 DUF58 domain-containing protein [Flavilitoribacter sp.]
METSELLRKVRKIEIKTKGLSNHIFSGEYHTAFKGRGMSFSEVRSYQYGDDVRDIDWNVTARTGEPYVKVYEEERELTVMLLVDVSQSAFFGTVNQLKTEIIAEICAVLAFSAINNNDKVGVIFFSDRVEMFIPPKKGRQHILRIIRELINFEPVGAGTDISAALGHFNNAIKKRSICFVLSDFQDSGYELPLRIAARRHDLVGVQLTDPAEATLPNIGLVRALDPETGALQWIDTSSRRLQKDYSGRYQRNYQYFRSVFLKCGADQIPIRTDESYVKALQRFFQKRMG